MSDKLDCTGDVVPMLGRIAPAQRREILLRLMAKEFEGVVVRDGMPLSSDMAGLVDRIRTAACFVGVVLPRDPAEWAAAPEGTRNDWVFRKLYKDAEAMMMKAVQFEYDWFYEARRLRSLAARRKKKADNLKRALNR